MVERVDHNRGKIHDAAVARFRITRYKPDGKTMVSQETLEIPGRAASARWASARTSPTSSSPACPGVQKEGTDGIITSATFILHRMPKHVRTVCLEFFGDVKRAVPCDRRDQEVRRRASRAPSSRASSTWTSAT